MFFRELLTAFAAAKLPYCIVGGVAVNLHGVPRMTYDIDVVVSLDPTWLEQTETVLRQLGLVARQPVRLGDFADPEHRRRMLEDRNLLAVTFTDPRDPLREVDVLVAPPIDPEELIAHAAVLDLDGTPAPVVSLADLVRLKRAGGRAQDEADLRHLERLLNDERDPR